MKREITSSASSRRCDDYRPQNQETALNRSPRYRGYFQSNEGGDYFFARGGSQHDSYNHLGGQSDRVGVADGSRFVLKNAPPHFQTRMDQVLRDLP